MRRNRHLSTKSRENWCTRKKNSCGVELEESKRKDGRMEEERFFLLPLLPPPSTLFLSQVRPKKISLKREEKDRGSIRREEFYAWVGTNEAKLRVFSRFLNI